MLQVVSEDHCTLMVTDGLEYLILQYPAFIAQQTGDVRHFTSELMRGHAEEQGNGEGIQISTEDAEGLLCDISFINGGLCGQSSVKRIALNAGLIEQPFIVEDQFCTPIGEGAVNIGLPLLVALEGPEAFYEGTETGGRIDSLVLHCRGFALTIYEFVWRGRSELSITDYICWLKHLESNYSSYQENELLADLRSGSEAAFTEVYRRLYKRVYLFATRFLEQPADAQDLTAETFVQLWNRRTEFYNLDGVAAFLHVTVRNKCFNLLKHQHMKEERREELLQLLSEQDSEDFYIEKVQSELLGRIYAEVDKLPPRMREVFLLSYREGLKPAEIAEKLQIKVQTVTNQRVSAVRLLQLALRQDPMAIILLALISKGGGFLS